MIHVVGSPNLVRVFFTPQVFPGAEVVDKRTESCSCTVCSITSLQQFNFLLDPRSGAKELPPCRLRRDEKWRPSSGVWEGEIKMKNILFTACVSRTFRVIIKCARPQNGCGRQTPTNSFTSKALRRFCRAGAWSQRVCHGRSQNRQAGM